VKQQTTKVVPTPSNGNSQVVLDVPESMTAEQYKKMIQTFTRNKEKGQKIARADGRALRRLIKAHKPEFTNLRREEWKAEGLDPSNIKG